MGICIKEKKKEKKCQHDWMLIESCDDDTEYGYESGNQYVIRGGAHYDKFQCRFCGETDKRDKY